MRVQHAVAWWRPYRDDEKKNEMKQQHENENIEWYSLADEMIVAERNSFMRTKDFVFISA